MNNLKKRILVTAALTASILSLTACGKKEPEVIETVPIETTENQEIPGDPGTPGYETNPEHPGYYGPDETEPGKPGEPGNTENPEGGEKPTGDYAIKEYRTEMLQTPKIVLLKEETIIDGEKSDRYTTVISSDINESLKKLEGIESLEGMEMTECSNAFVVENGVNYAVNRIVFQKGPKENRSEIVIDLLWETERFQKTPGGINIASKNMPISLGYQNDLIKIAEAFTTKEFAEYLFRGSQKEVYIEDMSSTNVDDVLKIHDTDLSLKLKRNVSTKNKLLMVDARILKTEDAKNKDGENKNPAKTSTDNREIQYRLTIDPIEKALPALFNGEGNKKDIVKSIQGVSQNDEHIMIEYKNINDPVKSDNWIYRAATEDDQTAVEISKQIQYGKNNKVIYEINSYKGEENITEEQLKTLANKIIKTLIPDRIQYELKEEDKTEELVDVKKIWETENEENGDDESNLQRDIKNIPMENFYIVSFNTKGKINNTPVDIQIQGVKKTDSKYINSVNIIITY